MLFRAVLTALSTLAIASHANALVQAASFPSGDTSSTIVLPIPVSDGDGISFSHDSISSGYSFVDEIGFDLTAGPSLNSAASFTLTAFSGIVGLELSLWDSTGLVTLFGSSATGSFPNQVELGIDGLADGSYLFRIEGMGDPGKLGPHSYDGDIRISDGLLPEASTGLLLAAGLAVLAIRRRSTASRSV